MAKESLAPFERTSPAGDGPYQVQHELQGLMQDKVGIVRKEHEMQSALEGLKPLWERARRLGVSSNREYNSGWHTALDLTNLLTISEAITRAALERKESRGGHFREDFPEKSATFGGVNIILRKGKGGAMEVSRQAVPELPPRLKQVIEEMK
jgi:succinate dehydrogenase / fumarate reductase flavoprotein subunit